MPRCRALLIAVSVVSLTVFISPLRRELFIGDETKYAQVVREMRANGAVFLPTLNSTPFTHKPPLHFWIIDLLTYVLGLYSIWSFVIPSLLAYVLLLWLVARISRELMPESDALLAAFISGTSLLVWASAQTARMDVGFTALITLGVWLLYRFLTRDDFRQLLLSSIALAIATLIKGPMSAVIAAILFIIEGWRRRRVPRGNYVPAIAVLVGIPLLWFGSAVFLGGDAYAREVLQKQIAGRAIGAWVHRSPPWFYVVHAPATLFPWFLLLVIAIVALYRRSLPGKATLDRSRDGANFCVAWIAAVLVPYSMMSSKLDIYMMALVPPMSLLIADYVSRQIDDRWVGWGRVANITVLVILAAIGALAASIGVRFVKGPEQAIAASSPVRAVFIVLAFAGAAGAIVSLLRRELIVSTVAIGLAPLAPLTLAAAIAMPAINSLASAKPLIEILRSERVAPERIALYTAPHLWSRDMPRSLERVRQATPEMLHSPNPPEVIITSRKHADEIADVLRAYRKTDEIRMIGKWFDVYRR